MSFIRRRYYVWLIKEYIKRWNKTIISSIIIGIGSFFVAAFVISIYISPLMGKNVQKVGYTGSYTISGLPREVLSDVSYGLTKVNDDGTVLPAAAYKWEIRDNGREYIFYIKKGQYFHDKKELKSDTIDFNFKDVEKKNIDEYTISIRLKDPYVPFLSFASVPIIGKDFVGLGEYKVEKIDVNAGFVKSIVLRNKNSKELKKIINFYPTQDALKTAYLLGEIDRAVGVRNVNLEDTNIAGFANTNVTRDVNYRELVVLFYNNADSILSNKKIRQALNYSIPETFEEGERAYSPIPPRSIFFSEAPNYGISDITIAKDLIESEKDILSDKTLEISTTAEYEKIAAKIANSWRKIGVSSKIKITGGLPDKFQILIYPIKLPIDPDQYVLWHSSQANNIAKYTNLRIDKLLEDGRLTHDTEQRKVIYADFQKYIIDDTPASFLYFPHEYIIQRK